MLHTVFARLNPASHLCPPEKPKTLNKIISVIGILSLVITALALTAPTTALAKEKESITVNATAFGADPSGKTDSAPAVEKAIEKLKELRKAHPDKSIVLRFPTGRYDFYPDKAPECTLYVSNTVGASERFKKKRIGILIEDLDDVTIDGSGSLFMYHGKMTEFAAINSKKIKIQNVATDFATPTVIDIAVEKVDSDTKTATFLVPKQYNYSLNGNDITWYSDSSPYSNQRYWTTKQSEFSYMQAYDASKQQTWRAGNPNSTIFANVTSIKEIKTDNASHLKVTYSSPLNKLLKKGMYFQMRLLDRDHPGMFIWKSKDVAIEKTQIGFLHGFGIVGQHSENITIDNVRFEAPAETGRSTSGFADFIQMSGTKGKIQIINSYFSNPHDDPINVHGTFNEVVEKIAANKIRVRFKHHETAGFPNYFIGDQVEFSTKGNMITVPDSVRTVTAVDGPDGRGGIQGEGSGNLTDIILTFDKDIPAQIGVNGTHVVENITYTPEVEISNNVFTATPTRGILVTTRKKVVIENNTFDGIGMAGIYISNDAQGWYESGPVRNLTIKNNTFLNGSSQAIFIQPTNPTVSETNTVHSNVTITGNKFYILRAGAQNPAGNGRDAQRVLDAKSTKDLSFTDNTIWLQDPGLLTLTSEQKIVPVGGSMRLLTSGTPMTNTSLYRLQGNKTVTIANNKYGQGLDTSVDVSQMDSANINISNDLAKTNGAVVTNPSTSPTVTRYFVSSNPNVIKVDSEGIVYALSEGSATLTMTEVVGTGDKAVKRTSNPLTLQVSTTAGVPQEIYSFTDKWSIETEDSAHQIKPKEFGFTSTYSSGGLYQEQQGKNILVGQVIAPESSSDFEITVRQQGLTSSSWSDTGVYLYKDQNNYLAIQRKHRNGNIRKIAQVRESSAKAQETWYGGNETVRAGENAESVLLKFSKQGNTVTTYFSADNGKSWNKIGQADASFLGKDIKLAFASASSSDPDGNNTPVSYTDITLNGKKIKLGTKKTVQDITPSGKIPTAKNSQARITGSVTGLLDGEITTIPNVFNYAATTDGAHSLIKVAFKTSPKANMRLQLNNKELKPGADGTFESIQLAPGTNILKADVIAEDGITHSVYRWTMLNTDTHANSTPATSEASRSVQVNVPNEQANMGTAVIEPNTIKGVKLYKGDTVTLKATPAEGYRFTGWRLADKTVSFEPEFSYTVTDRDVIFNATFAPIASPDTPPIDTPPSDTPTTNPPTTGGATPDTSSGGKATPKGVASQKGTTRQAQSGKNSKPTVAGLTKTGSQDVFLLALTSFILVSGGAIIRKPKRSQLRK